MSVFCFIDKITELERNQSVTALYTLKGNEEFLKDHFADFPVMPGVLLVEALKQAASELLVSSRQTGPKFYRLVEAQEVKFGQFVRPGTSLRIMARMLKEEANRNFFEGRIDAFVTENSGSTRKVLTANLSLEPVGFSVERKSR